MLITHLGVATCITARWHPTRRTGYSVIYGSQIRIVTFITYSAEIRHILKHIGAETERTRSASARGLPLWDEAHAAV